MALTGLVNQAQGFSTIAKDATSVANAVLVIAQGVKYDLVDQASAGKSLLFSQRGEDALELQSEIPDHTTEKNEPMEDDIALKPEIVTVRGFIGELTDQVLGPLSAAQAVQTQLTTLNAYQPALAVQALEAFNAAQQLLSTAAAAFSVAQEAFDLATGQDYENAQQKAFRYLYSRWNGRSLFTVLTPWTVMKDMAILTLRAMQDEDNAEISEFSVTFKRLRFAQSELSTDTVAQGRRAAQASSTVNHGPQNPSFVGPLQPSALRGVG